ncbi:MAG: ATP-binding protein [Myxococcota bacterium]
MTADIDRSATEEVEARLASLRELLDAERTRPARTRPDLASSRDASSDDPFVHFLGELELALEALAAAAQRVEAGRQASDAGRGPRGLSLGELPVPGLVTDAEGRIASINAAAARLLGQGDLELVGRRLSELVVEGERTRLADLLDGLRTGGLDSAIETDLRVLGRDGHPFTASLHVAVARDEAGRVASACWVVQDRTEALRLERLACERREREAYRQVAGGVIHHINNLLASIRGYSEMIQGLPELDERGRRAVQQIALGTERGERLTSQLMAFTHAGARSATVESLDALVEEACDVARLLLPETVEIVHRPAPAPLSARVDARGIYQTVLNLILNARDALEEGGAIEVETRRVELDGPVAERLGVRPGSFAAIRVSDTGSGMLPDVRARALEPFFSTKPIGEGFGLGLATAEAIVREAGGAIDLRSEANVGTRVTLHLPILD